MVNAIMATGEFISIHAPTRGATDGNLHPDDGKLFQSTLPREERRKTRDTPPQSFISIHAPTRGATHDDQVLHGDTLISIHAPTRGATFVRVGLQGFEKFQSTLPREERRRATVMFGHKEKKFQSTLPREERRAAPSPSPAT